MDPALSSTPSRQPEDRVRTALVLVRHSLSQAVDVRPVRSEAQVAEHVVERAVLEHQHDDVLDLVEGSDRFVELDLDETRRGLGSAREEGPK